MDLNYSPEDEAFRLRVRQWIKEHPSGSLETLAQKKAWQRTLYDAGFVGMGWPREYGGQDARPMEQAIVAEEMARGNVPGAINSLGDLLMARVPGGHVSCAAVCGTSATPCPRATSCVMPCSSSSSITSCVVMRWSRRNWSSRRPPNERRS